jgi:integrase/recombinase XerD
MPFLNCELYCTLSRPVSKELTVSYKQKLTKEFSARTVNVYIAGLNRLLRFMELADCVVKSLKIQRQVYLAEEKELTKSEYMRLLGSASPKLRLIMETICGTGIRVSELQYFTKEGVEAGTIHIRLKGKCRDIIVNQKLRKKLLDFCKQNKIETGVIFLCKKWLSDEPQYDLGADEKALCGSRGAGKQGVSS